ncbi:HsmA family protein [Clostridium sp. C8-1-8]|uniref:HsmA family protein n=1 Tax=Clostridium sp. C8-1-8 TaxID=2698831 RepID=UPI00136A0D48|nr:HsmA family protein [Clostridium sp. C8-1-8]
MNIKLILAIVSITAALLFYTIGVLYERKTKLLQLSQVFLFWTGFLFDTLGTSLMTSIARGEAVSTKSTLAQSIHGLTGSLAILLMAFHAIWATYVIYKNDVEKKKVFHKFSIFVWLVWLIPYFIGMFMGMSK